MNLASPSRSGRHSAGPGLFRPALELLVGYARVHRDRRNIQTHLVGVPVGIVGVALLMRGPLVGQVPALLTPAWVAFALVSAWYLTRGQFALGLATSALVGALVFAAHAVPVFGLAPWLAGSLGLLVLASLLQMAGHYYEGRRPATWQSPVYLLVGPMFVAFELLSGAGLMRRVAAEVTRVAGPVHVRDLAHPMPQR
mgnify:CR=1 FL=1